MIETEWTRLCSEYPQISWNEYPENRNKGKYLFATEAKNIKPTNYDIDISRQYKGVITWNSKWAEILKQNGIPVYKCHGFPRPDDFYSIKHNLVFGCRDSVCLVCRVRPSEGIGDISSERIKCFSGLTVSKKCYGKIPYCRPYYHGVIGDTEIQTIPSSQAKLDTLNQFRFNVCFENCYHEIWSWDYVTEKIFDAFKAKCIPIYYGAYNIEQLIPSKYFIDYRQINGAVLNTLLDDFTPQRFTDMTEGAFEWVKTCRWGNMDDLRQLLEGLK